MAAVAAGAADEAGETVAPYRPGYELVAEQLLQYIAAQGLRPGDRLPTEQGLAEILGVTRNVTREAVKVLSALGRVSVRRGAGIFVAESNGVLADAELANFQPTDMEQVLMLIDYRQFTEAETARRAATSATPVQVRAIRDSAKTSLDAGTADDIDAFGAADAAFHTAIAAAAGNVFLQASVANTRKFAAQSDVLLFHGDAAGPLSDAGAQHVEIAEAIAVGDSELAATLMVAHIDTTRAQFEHRIRTRLFSRLTD
ncbi:MAG: FadR/GntR family transcriptional regulator [Agromyces sp.]